MQIPVFCDDAAQTIPFRLYRNQLILVEGQIGPLDDLTFLIDTGASSCYLSRDLAKKLKKQKIKGFQKKSCSYGKMVGHEVLILPELRIGPSQIRTIPAGVIPISKLPLIGGHIDAIVGLSALRRGTNLTIDYEKKTISFDEAAPFASSTDLDVTQQGLIVKLQVGGRVLRLLLDTGAKYLILYRESLQGPIPGKRLPVAKKLYHVAGSQEFREMVRLTGIQFGQDHWEKLNGYLLEAPIDCCRQFDGILGLPSLELSRIHFDFHASRFSWEP